ncbi:AlpA family phage regulatory protein [Polynucleobacter paneuropaeus]|nr:AlpA family phage regulatory protein [Polynucleobacter paneuropaeus]MBT8577342.1 AlpA family phage regulatory protein [Polynucleobacter paneuropaeus]
MYQYKKQIFRIKDIVHIYGLSRSTLYRQIKRGVFPKPVGLTDGSAVGWFVDDVQTWFAERKFQSI